MPKGMCTVCAAKVPGLVRDSTDLRRLMEYIHGRMNSDGDVDDQIEWIDSLITRNDELSSEISYLRDFAE